MVSSVTGGTVNTPGTIIGNADGSITAQGQNSAGAQFGYVGSGGAHIAIQSRHGTAASRDTTTSFYSQLGGATNRSVGYQAFVLDPLTATSVEGVAVSGTGWSSITGTGKGISLNIPARGGNNWSIHSEGSAPVYFASPFTANGGNNNTDFRIISNGQIRSIPTFNDTNTSDTNLVRVTVDGGFQKSTSSRRYKDNIRDCELFSSSATDALKQIQPRTWEDHNTGETVNGFVAEELYEVGGEGMVSFAPWRTDEGEYRVGNGLAPVTKNAVPMSDDVEVIDGISDRSLTILLTKALQEALARIEELESNTLQPLYSTLADLPDASEHHGKTAHVHSEGALYFAHAGNWVKLQNA